MGETTVEVRLYGALARHVSQGSSGFARLDLSLPVGSTMADLLMSLGIGPEERGITFVNGRLSAMPGQQPDLGRVLRDGDRVGIFDPKSMWPFQYRDGAAMTEEMARSLQSREDGGLHHSYRGS